MAAGGTDTIFSLASGAGRAAVAVIRISGPHAGPAMLALTGRDKLPPPRHAGLARMAEPATGEWLDEGVVVWLPGPRK